MGVLVSVNTITYNHEAYIAAAIDSFLRQKTDFEFEILLGEDHGIDGTLGIIQDYVRRYPEKVRLITDDHNVGMMENVKRLFKHSKGTYIAICEGDDYWTDDLKLQKQVDFMRLHPDCSLCCHAASAVDVTTGERIGTIRPFTKTMLLHDNHFLFGGGDTIPTASLFFPREYIMDLPGFFNECPVGDQPIAMILSSKGRVGYLDEIMSVRNWMVPFSWNTTIVESKNTERKICHFEAMIKLLKDFDTYSNKRFTKDICHKILYLKNEKLILECKNHLEDADFQNTLHELPIWDQWKVRLECKYPQQCLQIAQIKSKLQKPIR